ncbi:hypothetical protein B0T17DRAFT_128013 [Bombardia bombarda]|uniref:Uncharacterized protein n=1 Tax=Bombardia bombarda TaxID=252184 RepID=A0AA39TK42_9PEZI|nr:hypothetical protein B0T17DRAFT_128013 [Bombardia bombarda]
MPPKRKSVQAEEPAAEPSRRRSLRNTNKPSPVHVTEKAKLSAATPKVQKTKAEIRAKPNKRGAAEAAAKPVEGSVDWMPSQTFSYRLIKSENIIHILPLRL